MDAIDRIFMLLDMLLKNGENYKVIADLLGDTVEQVIKTYAHISDKDLISALSKI